MKGRAILYSPAEEAFLRAHGTMARRELRELFADRFGRPEMTVPQIKSKCTRMGLKTGRTGCFPKGTVPPNKGRRGVSHPKSKRSQFKPGQVPPNAKPLGHERLCSKNGYWMMKVARPNPYTGAKTRVMPKHRYLWEEANGPIPARHVLRSLDGDPANWALENWVLVTFGVNARLNVAGYNSAPAALKPAILATCLLQDRIGEIEPSAAQQYRRRPNFKNPTRKTEAADNLRGLLVEQVFYYDCTEFGTVIDEAIARAYPDKSWSIDLSDVLPAEPKVVHIDWRRAIKRADIRNRILEFWPEGLPANVRRL